MQLVQNDFIDYLNSLNNLSASGSNALAESQALNKFFPEIYEPFPIVDSIIDLLNINNNVVILTGHAGDGKSTVALDVYKRLKGISPEGVIDKALNEIEKIPELGIGIIKDMSELSLQEREKYLTMAFEDDSNSWLIVSNTGPLLKSLENFSEKYGVDIESDLLKILNTPIENKINDKHKINSFNKNLYISNLTKLDNVDVSTRIFQKLINHSGWNGCTNCSIKNKCPIRQNNLVIKDRLSVITNRLRYLYLIISYYESRLTLRQILAQLSFSITGGTSCNKYKFLESLDQVEDQNIITSELGKVLFSELFFGYSDRENLVMAEDIQAIKMTKKMDFGGPIDPVSERKIQSDSIFGWAKVPEELISLTKVWQHSAGGHDNILVRNSLRRLCFIFGENYGDEKSERSFLSTFLKSTTIIDFENWMTSGQLNFSSREKRRFKESCMKVFLEFFTGFSANQFKDQDKVFITMKRPDNRIVQPTQIIIESIPFKRFDIKYNDILRVPEIHFDKGVVILPLSLPLLDHIQLISSGEIGNDLSPIHKGKFDWFCSELLRATSDERRDIEEVELLRSSIDGEVKVHKFILDTEDNKLELE